MYLTNVSLNYIHYILRVVFKSSRLLPVMVRAPRTARRARRRRAGVGLTPCGRARAPARPPQIMGLFLQGRRYTSIDYAAALSLILSIVFFALGNRDAQGRDGGDHSEVNTSLALLGVALITVATFFDAFYANFVEKFFFRRAQPSSRSEVVAYTGLVSMAYTFVAVVLRGELSPGLAFFAANRAASVTLLFASLMGYLSLNCNVLVTKLYDCTRTEVVKSSRKIATVVISFVVRLTHSLTRSLAHSLPRVRGDSRQPQGRAWRR